MAGNRLKLDSDFQLTKCAKRCYADNDLISQLPDDILVSILCLLPMKEAARTSVLSSRWINLWKHISCLDFDAESALVEIANDYELHGVESGNYVNWVNRVLLSHKGSNLKEFRVCFDLSRSDEDAITQWLEFALLRHVEKLELDFSARAENIGTTGDTFYVLPNKFLNPPSQRSRINFTSLKSLSLKCVKVTGEAIEFFLHNCPSLEKLVVHYSNEISKLEVCGSSLPLKHLELRSCYELKSLKVSAPNLTSLIGPHVDVLLLENVPMLVEVSVSCVCTDYMKKLLVALSCHIFQLETLTLVLPFTPEAGAVFSNFPQLPKLKKLVINYMATHKASYIGLTRLMGACPYLQEFVLDLMWAKPWRLRRKVKSFEKFPHEHLKVFKFSSYYGSTSDVEFVRYILGNCLALEKIVVDPRFPCNFPRVSPHPEILDIEQTARVNAKQQLKPLVPKHIDLDIM